MTRHPLPFVVTSGVLVLAAGACEAGTQASPRIEIDSAGTRIVASDPLASDAICSLSDEPTLLLGDSEGDESEWFTRVLGLARLSDGSVAVADEYFAEVRIFDAAGTHLRSFGRLGEGPGEFSNLWLMWRLPGDSLLVGDYRPQRYHLYSAAGEWIRTATLDPLYPDPTLDGGVLANGISINVRDERSRAGDFTTPDTRHVEAHAPDGKLMGTLASLPGRTFGTFGEVNGFPYLISPWFDPRPSIDAAGRTVAMATGRDTEVRVLDDEMRLRLIIRWDEPVQEVTAAHIRASRDAERQRAMEDGELSPYERVNLNPERPAADVFPAVSSVQVGQDGAVWVWRYRRPGESDQARAMGFGPDGEFVCHLIRGMDDYSIWEFGTDYVLGTHTDELGVQRVAMYDLERPAQRE